MKVTPLKGSPRKFRIRGYAYVDPVRRSRSGRECRFPQKWEPVLGRYSNGKSDSRKNHHKVTKVAAIKKASVIDVIGDAVIGDVDDAVINETTMSTTMMMDISPSDWSQILATLRLVDPIEDSILFSDASCSSLDDDVDGVDSGLEVGNGGVVVVDFV